MTLGKVLLGVWLVFGVSVAHAQVGDEISAHAGYDGWSALLEAMPRPQDVGPLPSDLGAVSIEASRRSVQADITDWTDDRDAKKTPRAIACAMAGAEAGVLVLPAGPLATLVVVGQLERYLTGPDQAHGASAPLSAPLSELTQRVHFTASELKTLERLIQRETPDLSDRIRLAIDTQSFLIQVSQRLYQEQIDYHFERTKGFWGFFRADFEFCALFTLVIERDNRLIEAEHKILDLYNSLEHELKD